MNLAFLEVDETFCFPTPVVIVSDTLSRLPTSNFSSNDQHDKKTFKCIPSEKVKALCHSHLCSPSFVACLNQQTTTDEKTSSILLQKCPDELLQLQLADPLLLPFIEALKNSLDIPKHLLTNTEIRRMNRFMDQLVLRKNLLFRKRIIEGDSHFQFVVPQSMRQEILHMLHTNSGHMGQDRTVDLVQQSKCTHGYIKLSKSTYCFCLGDKI